MASASIWHRSSRAIVGPSDAQPAGAVGYRFGPGAWRARSSSPRPGTRPGLYQVGSFVGDSWREWNGRFRDDVRSFFRGDEGSVARLADRLLGSPEIYGHKEREAEQSVNFVTCHDGFTLNDLVSYNQKHNEANGEGQPRWRQRQPKLELRRRGPHRRSRGRERCETGR